MNLALKVKSVVELIVICVTTREQFENISMEELGMMTVTLMYADDINIGEGKRVYLLQSWLVADALGCTRTEECRSAC